MKNLNYQKGISPIIAIILLAVILISGAYYFKQQAKPASKPVVVDATANWKTFTSEISKFTFKYPSDWEFQTSILEFPGRSEITQLFSVKPQKESNIYFCLTFRDNPSKAIPSNQTSIRSENFTSLNGEKFSIDTIMNTYSSNKSIENSLYLTQNGSTIIPTKEGRFLEVSGSFNCTQGDNIVLSSINDNFDSREEVQTAKTILKTFKFADQNQTPSVSADTFIQNYYNAYLTCLNKHFANVEKGNSSGKTPEQDCPNNANNDLTPALDAQLKNYVGGDPVLCAQNTPQSLTFDKTSVLPNGTATVVVHTIWGGNAPRNINVGLQEVNNQWKIASINCNK